MFMKNFLSKFFTFILGIVSIYFFYEFNFFFAVLFLIWTLSRLFGYNTQKLLKIFNKNEQNLTKKCLFCWEKINEDSIKCRFCWEFLTINKKWWQNYDSFRNFIDWYAIVEKDNKRNLIDNKWNLLFDDWFSYIPDWKFYNWLLKVWVRKDWEYYQNIVNKKGNLLLTDNYKGVWNISNKYFVVEKEEKQNLINKNNDLLLDKWYDFVSDFSNWYSLIEDKSKWRNFIDKKWKIILKDWLNNLTTFNELWLAHLVNWNKENWIDKKWKFKFSEWYDYDNWYMPFKEWFTIVNKKNKKNIIDIEWKLLLNEWVDYAREFNDWYFRINIKWKWTNWVNIKWEYLFEDFIEDNNELVWFHNWLALIMKWEYPFNKINFINTDWKFISEEWYDWPVYTEFNNGFAIIEKKNKWFNYIDNNWNVLSNIWFDCCYEFRSWYWLIKNTNWYNLIASDWNILSNIYFDNIFPLNDWYLEEGNYFDDYWFAQVYKDEKWNFINKEWSLLSKIWFDEIWSFSEWFAYIKDKNKGVNFIDKDWKILY